MEYKSNFFISNFDMKRIKQFELTKFDKILSEINNEEQKNKLNGIFYNGQYGKYSCKGTSSKDDAYLEFKRRATLN